MPLSNTGVDRFLAQNYYSKSQLNSGQLDTRYFAESEFIATSAGAGDAGKPIKLDSGGKLDASFIDSADFSGYALLAGRAGGQTLYGGTAANEDIIIHGTSNATRTTSYVILQPTAGNVGVGTSSPGAKLSSYESTALGSTGGNSQVAAEVGGNAGGNSLTRKLWLYRDANGSDWQTARLHDAIDIDGSYNTPGSSTRVWYERDPFGVIHAWGDQATTYMTLSSGTLNVATAITQNSVAVVTTSGTQTLTNKTLTAPTLTTPVIATISNTGTLTLPTSTDTLVGRATTDTLTNKTLTTPTIASFTNATHSHQNNAGGGTLDHGAALTGLTDDDHTQYGLLAGRSSGQTLNGGNAANEDIIINGTAHATKASSYVILQPTGGNVVVGGSTAEYNFEVQDQGGSNYRMTVNLNDSSENVLGSINDAVGSYTQAPLRIFASRIRFNGVPNIMTSATPTGSGSGTAGDIAWDTSYIYVCTATNTWKRAALSTF